MNTRVYMYVPVHLWLKIIVTTRWNTATERRLHMAEMLVEAFRCKIRAIGGDGGSGQIGNVSYGYVRDGGFETLRRLNETQ